MTIKAVRTPDAAFENLPGYDFAPHYVENLKGYEGLRMHYLDEGPKDAEHTFLCLHGQPTWCYLYRKMIPIFVAEGHRVVAPDYFGFGRSDKPVDDETYTIAFHRNALLRFIDHLDLHDVTLVCQDWGGLLGLTLPVDKPDLIARLLVMNTAISTGAPPGEGFLAWKAYAAANPNFDIAKLMKRSAPELSDDEAAAYAAPFPGSSFRAGTRRFPEMVPISPDMEGADLGKQAAKWWREEWQGQSFMAIGMQDPVLGPDIMRSLNKLIKNCPAPLEIADAGHFVQEQGEGIAKAALSAWS